MGAAPPLAMFDLTMCRGKQQVVLSTRVGSLTSRDVAVASHESVRQRCTNIHGSLRRTRYFVRVLKLTSASRSGDARPHHSPAYCRDFLHHAACLVCDDAK